MAKAMKSKLNKDFFHSCVSMSAVQESIWFGVLRNDTQEKSQRNLSGSNLLMGILNNQSLIKDSLVKKDDEYAGCADHYLRIVLGATLLRKFDEIAPSEGSSSEAISEKNEIGHGWELNRIQSSSNAEMAKKYPKTFPLTTRKDDDNKFFF